MAFHSPASTSDGAHEYQTKRLKCVISELRRKLPFFRWYEPGQSDL